MVLMVIIIVIVVTRDSSVGITTVYGLDGRDSIPGKRFFSSPRNLQ
jgi:hypothetical protein